MIHPYLIIVGLTLRRYDGLKKTEIEVGLDEYLSVNAPRFSEDKRLAPFYKVRSRGSPVKKEAETTVSYPRAQAAKSVQSVKRRATRGAEEFAT
jgi:hypothetical protein